MSMEQLRPQALSIHSTHTELEKGWETRTPMLLCRTTALLDRDGVVSHSNEHPVICQMQQLLVSMATTHGAFSVFGSSLSRVKAARARGDGGV